MSHPLADENSPLTPGAMGSSSLLVEMMNQGRSYSGRERNCCFLNCGPGSGDAARFANTAGISGFDYADDGRSLALR